MSKKLLMMAGALVLSTAGHALTYSVTPGAPDPGMASGESLLVDFNSPTLPPGYTLTGSYGYAAGTSGNAAAPARDTTSYLFVSSALGSGTATLTTAFDLASISFYWGSIDTFNTVDVLGTGGVALRSFGGSLFPPANGNQTGASSNERVFFTADTGEAITGLRFTTTGVAFEVDDVAGMAAGDGNANGTIPEPAEWTLMIAGFGFVGLAARRRRRSSSFAS